MWFVPGIKEKQVDYNEFREWLSQKTEESDKDQLKILDKLVILGDEEFYDLDIKTVKSQAAMIQKELSRYYLKNRMRETEKLIAELEAASAGSGQAKQENERVITRLLEEFKALSDELKRINN